MTMTITSNYPFCVASTQTTAPTSIIFNSFRHCSYICSPYPIAANQNCCVVLEAKCCNASAISTNCFCFYGNGVACGTYWCGGAFRNYTQSVNLTTSEYCKNCLYPVTVSVVNRSYSDETVLYVLNSLNTGCTADWMNHRNGFAAMAEIHTNSSGWGTITPQTYTTRLAVCWVKDNGVGNTTVMGFSITELTNTSLATLYLRGGAVWLLSASNGAMFTAHSSTYTVNNQSVSPICVTGTIPQQWNCYGHIFANICGNATNATYATCACCATNATCSQLVYLDSYTTNADRPVMVACPRGTNGYSDQGVSTACPLTFNPATGVLNTCTICGNLCGHAQYADNVDMANYPGVCCIGTLTNGGQYTPPTVVSDKILFAFLSNNLATAVTSLCDTDWPIYYCMSTGNHYLCVKCINVDCITAYCTCIKLGYSCVNYDYSYNLACCILCNTTCVPTDNILFNAIKLDTISCIITATLYAYCSYYQSGQIIYKPWMHAGTLIGWWDFSNVLNCVSASCLDNRYIRIEYKGSQYCGGATSCPLCYIDPAGFEGFAKVYNNKCILLGVYNRNSSSNWHNVSIQITARYIM